MSLRRTSSWLLLLVASVGVFLVSRADATALTDLEASCQTVADTTASSGGTGYVPRFKVMLYIKGDVVITGTENENYGLSTMFHFKNASNDYEFVPRRGFMSKNFEESGLTTYEIPFLNWITDAGDITLTYEELPFQTAQLMVNTTVHITSFTLTCPLISKTYLYNAHFWYDSTIAEFLFTREVVRCDNGTTGSFDASWFSYTSRTCESSCTAPYPDFGSICATDLLPYKNNTMRWWCVAQTNISAEASVQIKYVRYALAADRICDKFTNASVKTLNSNGVNVFRQNNGAPGLTGFVRSDELALSGSFAGFKYIDLQFSMPINGTLFGEGLYFGWFSYVYGLKNDMCSYYSDGGFPDGQMARLVCDEPFPLQPGESVSLALVGNTSIPVYWSLQNVSTTDSSGAAMTNYDSGISHTAITDGFPGYTYAMFGPDMDWIVEFGYVNTTAIRLTVARPLLYQPLASNLVCYDTDLGARYNISTIYRYQDTSTQFLLFFDDDSPLPDYAEDFIYCYFVYLGPSSATDVGVYMSIPLAVVPIPTDDSSTSSNSIWFEDIGGGGYFVLALLSFLSVIGVGFMVYTWRSAHRGYKAV